ncbi:hypothetical protein M8J76_005467 [Diaphorina citri]|nr:hypothetical protein M8J76_005467 [Diaphorina citri]
MRNLEFRPLDFIYDPNHIVSDKSDYCSHAARALQHVSQYAVQPQYTTMFSDNDKYHRNLVVFRSTILPHHVNVSWTSKKQQMMHDRKPRAQGNIAAEACKYFTRPNVTDLNPFTNINNIVMSPVKDEAAGHEKFPHQGRKTSQSKTPGQVRKAVQTIYRESEAQTHPWAPEPRGPNVRDIPYTLDLEKWENGFPVTQNELDMIERTKLRRVCEQALNSMTMLSNKQNLIKQIEIYEWLQREDDIELIYKLREKLSRKQSNVFVYLNQLRMEERMNAMINRKKKETEKKIDKITKKRDRELRKLTAKQNALPINDVVDVYNDYTSELYVRNQTKGANPKYRSRVRMGMTPLQMQRDLSHVEPGDTLLETQDIEAKFKPKTFSLCPQEKKWNMETLIKLYEKMKLWRMQTSSNKELNKEEEEEVIEEKRPESSSKVEDELNPEDDERYLNAVMIQKLIRGRKWQYDIQEGMTNAQSLIDEIKQTITLTPDDVQVLEDKKQKVFDKAREEDVKLRHQQPLDDSQGQIQGETISAVLDFLAKELKRLQDERSAHAYSLLAERQRELREAIESGKRQKELERRKEFDEMFKQMIKIKQDTVDTYLENVIMDSVQCTSQEQARRLIQEKAKAIDQQAQEAFLQRNKMEDEAIVADLLYNFAIPELDNIRMHSCEVETQRRQQTDINDLMPAMEIETHGEDDKEDDMQTQLEELQTKLINILFPMRNIPSEELQTMSSEPTSGLNISQMEIEIEDFSENVRVICEDIGKDMFEQLLETANQTYEKVTNQIIEEIIKTLLTKPIHELERSQSEFIMEFDATSFTEDIIGIGDYEEEEDASSNGIVESVSKISHESNEDYQEQ